MPVVSAFQEYQAKDNKDTATCLQVSNFHISLTGITVLKVINNNITAHSIHTITTSLPYSIHTIYAVTVLTLHYTLTCDDAPPKVVRPE